MQQLISKPFRARSRDGLHSYYFANVRKIVMWYVWPALENHKRSILWTI
nr:MAG TPA: Mitochondria-eating protein [Caudoviricetes sp.]